MKIIQLVGALLGTFLGFVLGLLILQRSGGSWHAVAAPRVATYESLAAVDATGAGDAWAVGSATSNIQSAPPAPLALHWTGSAWAPATLPAPAGTALTGVDARTQDEGDGLGHGLVEIGDIPL